MYSAQTIDAITRFNNNVDQGQIKYFSGICVFFPRQNILDKETVYG